ncbi:MAG TPA: type I pullulanase [Ferruginibacter sp.]|nr:type I pullulanase [Ferruginibacter sp.]
MHKKILFILVLFICQNMFAQTEFDHYPVYAPNDLGLTYTKNASTFRIWSPTADAAEIIFYKRGDDSSVIRKTSLLKDKDGCWSVTIEADLAGQFYVFRVQIEKEWSDEVTDPYAKLVGVNGKRAMVADLKQTNPNGWEQDKSPDFSTENRPTDAIIYELHIRDASMHPQSGIKQKGKFAGLAEWGTTNNEGFTTGLSHIKELGATHVHLLPVFDFSSIDESKPGNAHYNWGYDPLNYNCPEGSYSSNPYDGLTRVREMKEMIQAMHQHGLRVIMDVVYNHTAKTIHSNFNQLVPGYYYRHKKTTQPPELHGRDTFSDASGCGNETASEMPMMRKFIIESVVYWAKEYHIDGFRFDLMGIHDIETMNQLSKALHAIKPDIILYGEGWTAGASPIPDSQRALKTNAYKLDRIAVFSDDIRDGIKGSVFNIKAKGFVSNQPGLEEQVKFGVVASCRHEQVHYPVKAYATTPAHVISYCECHDNNTLWDKLMLACADDSEADRTRMQKLANTILLCSQGIPFLHAGTEFLRSKQGVENSYKSSDDINAIDWSLKTSHKELVEYIRSLIRMRKEHPAFRMFQAEQVEKYIRFEEHAEPGTVIFTIDGKAMGDSWKNIWIAFNGSKLEKKLTIPQGSWHSFLPDNNAKAIVHDNITIAAYSAVILYQP